MCSLSTVAISAVTRILSATRSPRAFRRSASCRQNSASSLFSGKLPPSFGTIESQTEYRPDPLVIIFIWSVDRREGSMTLSHFTVKVFCDPIDSKRGKIRIRNSTFHDSQMHDLDSLRSFSIPLAHYSLDCDSVTGPNLLRLFVLRSFSPAQYPDTELNPFFVLVFFTIPCGSHHPILWLGHDSILLTHIGPERLQHESPGQRPGYHVVSSMPPCKGKTNRGARSSCALAGLSLPYRPNPGRCPGLYYSSLSG